MDENQSPQQENQEPDSEQPPEPNVYEPQQRTQLPVTEAPTPKKSHKLALAIILLVLFLIAGGAAAYLMTQEEDSTPAETSQTSEETVQETEESTEEAETDTTYQSILYPNLSFTIPDGWEVSEQEGYEENAFGDGSADSVIKVTNGDVVLNLDLTTVLATGFEGYTCYSHEDLAEVGNVYRFVDSEGVIVYKAGISESSDNWAEVIAQEGEFTYFEDSDPNYCVSFPYIGTYSSTLKQADYPDYPYGYIDNEKVIVWMSASIEGAPTEAQQTEADEIIKSLSKPDLEV